MLSLYNINEISTVYCLVKNLYLKSYNNTLYTSIVIYWKLNNKWKPVCTAKYKWQCLWFDSVASTFNNFMLVKTCIASSFRLYVISRCCACRKIRVASSLWIYFGKETWLKDMVQPVQQLITFDQKIWQLFVVPFQSAAQQW